MSKVIVSKGWEGFADTNSTRSSVREYPDQPQENLPLGFVAVSRGWGRVEQAVVKVTTAVKWVVSKFYKPNNVV